MILHILCLLMMMMVSAVLCAPGQDGIQQNMMELTRKDKPSPRPSLSGTLDPIGGGNLVRLVDPEKEERTFRSLDSFESRQDRIQQNMMEIARKGKPSPRPSSSGTLDPLGGGYLLRLVDPEREGKIYRSMNSLENRQDGIQQNMMELSRKDKHSPRPSSSGTLDPIGGGHLLRLVDPEREGHIFRSMDSLESRQDGIQQNMMELARKDKPSPRPSSSGTLDPIGGGNLVRLVDPEREKQTFRSLDSFESRQGRQNMMRLAREDKSTQRPSHTIDSIGGGHLLGVVDPYRGGQIFRSLDRGHLLDSLDNYQGGEVLRMLDAITGSDLLSSLDSAEGVAVLSALKKTHTKHPKRMLDSVSGWAFGESKRNFDEIDNVGFTGFAKKSPPYYRNQYSSLAKKNFDEIDRAGFETYNKRDFDEIDRAGFETFEKRNRKD